jgi:predicted O-methyltransferase YrrM
MPYMLHFAAPLRVFTGIDYDEDKIEVANNNFNKMNASILSMPTY